ncbi:hypothetical protein LJD47_25980, partial [Escherichia coli]|nr:hypothetical protein [Escherichia coli]
MNETGQDEEALRAAQDGRLYPVGRALRATFDADNHDSLDRDVTGLMIDLSHVPYPYDGAGKATDAVHMAERSPDASYGLAHKAGLAGRLTGAL